MLRDMLAPISNAEKGVQGVGRAKLRNSTTVFLVGNIEPTMEWYMQLGFRSEYYPPGFAILRRDDVEMFLQQQPGYVAPHDSGRRERHAWNVYIVTDNVKALFEEYSALLGLKIARQLCPQDYGMIEFDVMDLNGHRLVFAQPITATTYMPSPLPRQVRWTLFARRSPSSAAFPVKESGRLLQRLFRDLLSVHSRYGLHAHQVA